jgi:excinuclease ABC subunit A
LRVPPTQDTPNPAPPVIAIRGAREHNLKNLSVEIPRGQFVVVTGVSGSGKSTLAFDLLFAEGQRRFLDSMNAYARQFVEQMARPEVDLISGIPPTVSIEQRNSRGGGKSTVATVTEIHHFVRLLFARLGTPYCPECQVPVEPQTRDEVRARLEAERRRRGPLRLLAPVVRGRKGFHSEVADWAREHGYHEVRADGELCPTDQPLRMDRFREHNVEIVTGVLGEPARPIPARKGRTTAAARGPGQGGPGASVQALVEATLSLGRGTLFALDGRGELTVHSTERACPTCGRSFAPLDPKAFSYNSAAGWCPRCRGFGELFYLPEDVDRGARADAIEESWWGWQEGKREPCPECGGARLNPVARAVRLVVEGRAREGGAGGKLASQSRLAGLSIVELGALSVDGALECVGGWKLRGRAAEVARDILPEIRERLRFLREVGLGYLELSRAVTTLSGGENQRIRLAAQLGSNLSGVLYILDEPTIGLHARDNERLLEALVRLQARGNSLVVVEHDEATMRRADWILDLGPGAGRHGGQVVATGTLEELARHPDSITGQCLREPARYPSRGQRRPPATQWLVVEHAAVHNLRDLTVRLPLGRLVLVTGVSGSGKSTLIRECLLPALRAALPGRAAAAKAGLPPGPPGVRVRGCEAISAVYEVDQSPIGRTPRSTPATYVGFFDDIRALFAQVPEARLRGYGPGRFSFNSVQGRCPECEGAGVVKLEMNFLPPAFVRCETCQGLRFSPETLDIELHGRNIAQVLDLSVAEALECFAAFPRIHRPLGALHDTGLDYLKLGQTSPTLSGGEAQRVKLVTHLLSGLQTARRPHPSLFILEEPTIGLHLADVRRLLEVLHRLVDAGHTVLVIEHNLDLIAEADWVVDLGPEGGAGGGRVVVEGTPETVAAHRGSHTGRYLVPLLHRGGGGG